MALTLGLWWLGIIVASMILSSVCHRFHRGVASDIDPNSTLASHITKSRTLSRSISSGIGIVVIIVLVVSVVIGLVGVVSLVSLVSLGVGRFIGIVIELVIGDLVIGAILIGAVVIARFIGLGFDQFLGRFLGLVVGRFIDLVASTGGLIDHFLDRFIDHLVDHFGLDVNRTIGIEDVIAFLLMPIYVIAQIIRTGQLLFLKRRLDRSLKASPTSKDQTAAEQTGFLKLLSYLVPTSVFDQQIEPVYWDNLEELGKTRANLHALHGLAAYHWSVMCKHLVSWSGMSTRGDS